MFGGVLLMQVQPLAFIGSVISLAGALSVFLVGMVYADLWAAHRRTRDIIKAREARGIQDEEEMDADYDPFIDEIGQMDEE
jgi:hypothetical protein